MGSEKEGVWEKGRGRRSKASSAVSTEATCKGWLWMENYTALASTDSKGTATCHSESMTDRTPPSHIKYVTA